MLPYRNLAGYWRERLGGAARRVPLDAGLCCPNRDGVLSRSGCLFCNALGSGTGLASEEQGGLSLAGQWRRLDRGRPEVRRIAYLQSYTNTHCSVERLAGLLDELTSLPGIAGASVGTRPDCLEQPKLDLLAAFAARLAREVPESEVWLDLGLQSADDATLKHINRGHDAACFADAARRAHAAGLKVCAHLMFGLPTSGEAAGASDRACFSAGIFEECRPPMPFPDLGPETEGPEALWRSVDFVNALPVSGVKFHNTMVVRGARLEALWRAGRYEPPGLEAYAEAVAQALARLRPEVVVHRLAADPAPGELLAPSWAARKHDALARIKELMATHGLRQGSRWKGGDTAP